MKRLKSFLILCFVLFIVNSVSAQNTLRDKVVLKTGETYTGEIVVQNSDILIIKLADGSRFQFNAAQIKYVTKETELIPENENLSKTDSLSIGNICGMLDIAGGKNFAPMAFGWSPFLDVSLSFGIKSSGKKSLFAGAGVGFSNTFLNGSQLSYIPVFVRFGSNNLTKRRTSPYFSMDAGYAFGLDNSAAYKGGLLGKLSVGIIHKMNYKTAFFIGPFAGVQSLNGLITETINSTTVTYNGYTTLYSFGLKTGIQF